MKNNIKFVIAGLIIMLSIFYPGPKAADAETETYHMTVTVDFEADDDGDLESILKKPIASAHDCEIEDIVLVADRIVKNEIKVEYTVKYSNKKTASKVDTVVITGDYDETEIMNRVEAALIEMNEDAEEIVDFQYIGRKETYDITYSFFDWEEEFNQSLCMTYGVPCTKRDKIAQLSPVTFYFQGYRIPYVLEDDGELYIRRDYVDSPIVDNLEQIRDGYFTMDDSYTFRNYSFKSFVKNGTEIGKIGSAYRFSIYELLDRYPIGQEDYVKLSELLHYVCEDDWRDNQLTYDKASKTLYYGRKPTKKEQSLINDSIYDFVEKTIKGCKTDKDKVIAIHDAIIKTFQYKSDALYYDHETYREYEDGSWNIDNAVQALKSKKGNEEALAILFQECCRRLFIPCEVIEGEYIWPDDACWNKVYIGSTPYHIDVANDLKGTSNKNNISRKYCLKSAYYFMGTHHWGGSDYKLEKFSKSWKSIDRNNIKTTDDLRRAVVYASYLCGDLHHKTYTFKITGSNVQTDCALYVMYYDYVNLAQQEYKNGVLTVTFN